MAVDTTVQENGRGADESVTDGTIVEEGGRIELDATIVEISTDKVEVPSPVAGAPSSSGNLGGRHGHCPRRPAARRRSGAQRAGRPRGRANGDGASATEADEDTAAGGTIDIVTPGAGKSITDGTLLEWTVPLGVTGLDERNRGTSYMSAGSLLAAYRFPEVIETARSELTAHRFFEGPGSRPTSPWGFRPSARM